MPTFLAMGNGVNHVAIYDGPNDDPFWNPYGHLDNIHFHTILGYIGFDSSSPQINTNVTVDGSLGTYLTTHTLAAHGKSGFPFVFGRCFARGVWMPLAGSIPVVIWTGAEANVINFTLAVNATHVAIVETRSFDSANAFSSFSVPVQVHFSREVA